MMCAVLAVAGSVFSVEMGSFPVWVDRMISPLGIFTRTPFVTGCTFSLTSWAAAKSPVAPVSSTKVGVGEGDKLYAVFTVVSLHLIFLPPSRNRQVPVGLPSWLPPLLSSRVASSWWPGFLAQQVLLVWSGWTRYPCVQQYPPRSLRARGVRGVRGGLCWVVAAVLSCSTSFLRDSMTLCSFSCWAA